LVALEGPQIGCRQVEDQPGHEHQHWDL
jgi:hypothetical protein